MIYSILHNIITTINEARRYANERKNQEKLKLLQPKNDFVFQSLFSEKNKEITKEFVSALLNEKIENMTINNTKELFREYPTDKLGILDLEADVNGREKVDIEVQMVKKEDFIDRLLFYFSKTICNANRKRR